MVTSHSSLPSIACILLAILLLPSFASSQPVSGSVGITGEFGAGFYIGEFNSLDRSGTFDPSVGYDAAFGIRYQIAENFALLGTVGFMSLSYVVDNDLRLRYGSNFFGPLTSSTYPGSTVALTKLNYIDATRFILFGQSHFTATSQLVPYFTLGLGLLDFSVKNGLGDELPRNLTGDYSNQSLVMPIGLGLYYFLDHRLSLHLQGLFYVNSTDYLDGYAHFLEYEETPGIPGPGDRATPPDYPVTLTIGATYAFYVPEEEYLPPIAEAPPVERAPEPEAPRAESPTAPAENPFVDANDRDGDGLDDRSEIERYLTDPLNEDTDGDNLTDYDEVFRHDTSPNHQDTDRDGLSDGDEVLAYGTKPLDSDTDDDLLIDGDEVYGSRSREVYASSGGTPMSPGVLAARTPTDPRNPDTDGDGVPDGLDDCPRVPGSARQRGCPDAVSGDHEAVSGYRADFDGITFKPNSDDFDLGAPGTVRDLRELLALASECDELGLLIEGHTSSEGSPQRNQQLSTLRARRVYDWLIANGVAKEKLLGALGYGSRLPRVYEPSAAGLPHSQLEEIRSRNRRITALVRRPCP